MRRYLRAIPQQLKDKYLTSASASSLASVLPKALGQELKSLRKQTNVTEQDVLAQEQTLSDFKWPYFRNSLYEQVMQKYMRSFKNIYAESINASNACLVTGPTHSGKSWFVRYNMRQFQASALKPLVFHFDLR